MNDANEARAVAHAMKTGDQSHIAECVAALGAGRVLVRYLRETKAHLGRRVSVDKLNNEARFKNVFHRAKRMRVRMLGRKLGKWERNKLIERLAGKRAFQIKINRAFKIANGEDKTVNRHAERLKNIHL